MKNPTRSYSICPVVAAVVYADTMLMRWTIIERQLSWLFGYAVLRSPRSRLIHNYCYLPGGSGGAKRKNYIHIHVLRPASKGGLMES
jgi:hypothetical protein